MSNNASSFSHKAGNLAFHDSSSVVYMQTALAQIGNTYVRETKNVQETEENDFYS